MKRFFQDSDEIEVTLKNIEVTFEVIDSVLAKPELKAVDRNLIKQLLQAVKSDRFKAIREALARMGVLQTSLLEKAGYQTKIEDLPQ